MEQPLVSIIVPIYKVEKYIDRCIMSITNQTYKKIEIILVDDGSPDNCPKICDNYASIDNRIKVIHQNNAGLSVARNNALDICTGEYVAFVDSDDWIENNLIEIAIGKMQEYSVDIVSFSANIVENDFVIRQEFIPFPQETLLSARIATEEILKDTISSQVWLRVYNRNCWNGIKFPKGRLYEDISTTYKVFEKAEHGICFIPDALYNYLHNNEGISLSASPHKAYHIYLGLTDHYEYAKQYYPHISEDCLKSVVINGMSVINCSLDSSSGFIPEGVDDVRKFMEDNKETIKQLKTFSLGRRIMLSVYYNSYLLYRISAKAVIWLRKVINR